MSSWHTSTFSELVYEIFHIHTEMNLALLLWKLIIKERYADFYMWKRQKNNRMPIYIDRIHTHLWTGSDPVEKEHCGCRCGEVLNADKWETATFHYAGNRANSLWAGALIWPGKKIHAWLTHQPQAWPTNLRPEALRWSPSAGSAEKLIKTQAQICNYYGRLFAQWFTNDITGADKNYKQKQSPHFDSVSLVDILRTISSSPSFPTPNIRLLHNGKIVAVSLFINSNKYLTRLNFCPSVCLLPAGNNLSMALEQ